MDSPVIEARGLGRTFGTLPILHDVALSVPAGGAALIIGRNGCGKSTLIRLLAGLASPNAGTACLFAHPSRTLTPSARRRVGLLTHQSFLYPNLTARENLAFFADLYGVADRAATVAAWLERVGLTHAADARVRTFSRGMEQRLTLARTMFHQPDVLLLDEPLAALDPPGVALVAELLRAALEGGAAAVMTAHEPLSLAGVAADLYELAGGRLRRLADPRAEPYPAGAPHLVRSAR